MLNQQLKAVRDRESSDTEDFNVSKLQAACCIGASALTTVLVLGWVARTYLAAVL